MKRSELRKLVKECYDEVLKEQSKEYKAFFKKAAKKFGFDPEEIDEIPAKKKKEFFNYVDKNWTKEKNGEGDMPGEKDQDEVSEIQRFPAFARRKAGDRVKAQKRKQILKVSEKDLREIVRKQIKEELEFLNFADIPGAKSRKQADRINRLFGDPEAGV